MANVCIKTKAAFIKQLALMTQASMPEMRRLENAKSHAIRMMQLVADAADEIYQAAEYDKAEVNADDG